MGNWRTVHIIGSCDPAEIGALEERLCVDYMGDDGFENWGPLSWSPSGSLCGVNSWVAPTMNTVGNLAERDYVPEDVADELRRLVEVAPSLTLLVHCGDDWESTECVATIVVAGGNVTVEDPQVNHLREVTQDESMARVAALFGGRP